MKTKFIFYLNLFWQMLKTDLIIFKKNIITRFIDTCVWVSMLAFVISYLYPQLGMAQEFGAFWLVGAIVSSCLFDIEATSADFVADVEGNKTITYPLTLPISSWAVFVKLALSYACKSAVFAIIIIPLGKLVLWDKLTFTYFDPFKFISIFLIINLFFGFFSLFMSSLVKKMSNFTKIWVRFFFPMWILGGVMFPWKLIYNISPRLAYLFLLNPITYANEGIRATVLSQKDYLPFWLCVPMLCFFGIIFGFWSIVRLKKQLDFV